MRKIMVFFLIALFLAALGGCGGSKSENAALSGRDAGRAQSVQPASQPAEDKKAGKEEALPGLERKIARNVSLVINVNDVEEANSRIQEMVKRSGGFVQNATLWLADGRMQGSLVLRVPAEQLDDLLPRLEALGKVEKRNVTGKDVTEEYYDTSARKTAFEKQEKRLLELLGKANTVKEMLEIENELARVRSQIESLQARIKLLDNLTSLATINIEIRSPKSISTGETVKEPFWQRIKAGWLRGINGMVGLVEDLTVLFVALLPYTPIFAIAGYVFYRLWKKRRA